jgi:hypothetical protein
MSCACAGQCGGCGHAPMGGGLGLLFWDSGDSGWGSFDEFWGGDDFYYGYGGESFSRYDSGWGAWDSFWNPGGGGGGDYEYYDPSTGFWTIGIDSGGNAFRGSNPPSSGPDLSGFWDSIQDFIDNFMSPGTSGGYSADPADVYVRCGPNEIREGVMVNGIPMTRCVPRPVADPAAAARAAAQKRQQQAQQAAQRAAAARAKQQQGCPPGQLKHPQTGQCVPCPPGSVLHPQTGRCVLISSLPTNAFGTDGDWVKWLLIIGGVVVGVRILRKR